jgi:hypothetical protein
MILHDLFNKLIILKVHSFKLLKLGNLLILNLQITVFHLFTLQKSDALAFE